DEVRQNAMTAIGRIAAALPDGDTKRIYARQLFLQATENPKAAQQAAAAITALGKAGTQALLNVLDKSSMASDRLSAVELIPKLGPTERPVILALMTIAEDREDPLR